MRLERQTLIPFSFPTVCVFSGRDKAESEWGLGFSLTLFIWGWGQCEASILMDGHEQLGAPSRPGRPAQHCAQWAARSTAGLAAQSH